MTKTLTTAQLDAMEGGAPPTDQPLTFDQAAERAFADMPWYQQAVVGAGKSANEVSLGLKSIYRQLTPQEQSELAAGKAVRGWGTAGEIAGDIAMMAVPGGAVSKVGKGLQKALAAKRATTLAKLAPTAAEVGAGVGIEAAKAPGEMSRAERAAWAAGGGAAGAGVGKVLKRAASGVRPTPAAQQMLDQGVPLTPGMTAGHGTMTQWIERQMRNLPVIGGRSAKLQLNALEQWNKNVLNDVTEGIADITKAGRVGFDQAQAGFDRAYRSLWGRVNKGEHVGDILTNFNQGIQMAPRIR